MRAFVRACVGTGVAVVLSASMFVSSGGSSQGAFQKEPTRPARPRPHADDRVSALSSSQGSSGTPPGTFSADAFQSDLFTGAATAEIPIAVPAGPAGVAPKIALRYNNGTAA